MIALVKVCLGCWGTWNMIIYFKGTKDILGINLREQGISVLLKGTLTTNFREKGRKSEIFL